MRRTIEAMCRVQLHIRQLQEAVLDLSNCSRDLANKELSERCKALVALTFADAVFFPRNAETAVQFHHGNAILWDLSTLLEIKK